MELDIMEFYYAICDTFDDEKRAHLQEFFNSVEFKLNKNDYHYNNILQLIDQMKKEHLDDVTPIYYESESLFISLRSSVDMLLHLLNFLYNLRISSQDITLNAVYRNAKLPKLIKNIFDRYTRPFNNPTWNFIYTTRNEIVHEKCINQVIPITFDFFSGPEPIVFISVDGDYREIASFFGNSIRFLQAFFIQMFSTIKICTNEL